MKFIPFTAVSRMSGVDYKGGEVRKGAAEAVKRWVEEEGGIYSSDCAEGC